MLGSAPGASDSVVWGGAGTPAFLTSSQVVVVPLVPDHTLKSAAVEDENEETQGADGPCEGEREGRHRCLLTFLA